MQESLRVAVVLFATLINIQTQRHTDRHTESQFFAWLY